MNTGLLSNSFDLYYKYESEEALWTASTMVFLPLDIIALRSMFVGLTGCLGLGWELLAGYDSY